MARIVTCGWETGSTSEANATLTGSNWSIDTGVPYEGSRCLKGDAGAAAANQYAMYTTGAAIGTKISYRFRLRFPANPALQTSIFAFSSTGTTLTTTQVRLSTAGKIQFYNAGSAAGSESAALAVDTWHLVEGSITIGTGSVDAAELSVNGVSLYSATGISITDTLITSFVGPTIQTNAGNNWAAYFDGLKINDGGGSSETGLPNAGALVLLLPAAESSDGSWTKPGGGTTNTYTSVDNVPPVSIADTTSSGDAEKQLRNPTANDAYALTLQSYTAAGASGTINGLHPVAVVGAPSSTQAKTGSLEGVSNPAITALSFSNYHSGTNAGTFPTGWKYVYGTYASAPSVTLGTQPVIRLNITGGTTSRIALAAFAGMYAEWTSAGYTLTAASASFALSGTATTLKADRKFDATTATSFALTGSNVALHKGYPLTAASGTFVLSGTAVTLRAARKLTAASASFTLSGTVVTLKRGLLMAAGAGNYTLTGTATGLYKAAKLTAASGSFTLTGTAASLKRDARITASAGTFTLTGSSASLVKGYKLSAGSGGFVLSGTSAALLRGIRLTAGAGTFTLSGTAAGLYRGLKLTTGLGAFTLTGTAATLTKTSSGAYVLAADAGSFALTGAAVGFRAARLLAALPGGYTLTGTIAGFQTARKLTAGVGLFAFAGTDTELTHHLAARLIAEAGAFNFTGYAAAPTYLPNVRIFRAARAGSGSQIGRLVASHPINRSGASRSINRNVTGRR